MLFLLTLLSTVEAGPVKGLRMNACVGIASYCPTVQLGVAYNTKKFAVDVGGFVVPPHVGAAHLGLQVYPLNNDTKRWFVGASVGGWTAIAGGIGGFGGYVGRDFHLLSSRKFIITPRIGYDDGGTYVIGGKRGVVTEEHSSVSFSLETAYAF